jgi:hypothetical protein
MKVLLAGRTGREYIGAEGAGDLHGDVTDAAGPAMDQYSLAGMYGSAIDQSFPCGDEDQRNGRGVAHGKISGFWREQIGIDSGIFRQRPLQAADTARHSKNFVAVLKGCHARTDRLDHAGKVDAENGGQWLARMSGLAGTNLDVERVDGAGFDPDQNLPRFGMRPRHRRNPERRTWAVEHRGLHHFRCCHGGSASRC